MESEFKSCFVEMKLENKGTSFLQNLMEMSYDFHETDSVGLKM